MCYHRLFFTAVHMLSHSLSVVPKSIVLIVRIHQISNHIILLYSPSLHLAYRSSTVIRVYVRWYVPSHVVLPFGFASLS